MVLGMTLTKMNRNEKGFSLIEILMVLILIAVLAAIAINAFINFRQEAQDAAVAADLKILRTGIAVQYSQMQLRCAKPPGTFPPFANLNANDITLAGAPCTNVQVPITSEAKFVQGSIPIPPTGTSNAVIDCQATGGLACARGADGMACDGTAVYKEQWCYNSTTGELWLDSAKTDHAGTLYEATY